MEEILSDVVFGFILIILGLIAGVGIGAKGIKTKDEVIEEDEEYLDLTGEIDLSELEYEKSIWAKMSLALHSYHLGGNEYTLDEIDITIDKAPYQKWSGINQCLFYMSDEAFPNKPELYEIRTNCNSNKTPWKVEAVLNKKKTGRYFIIGFANKHDFVAKGKIKIRR